MYVVRNPPQRREVSVIEYLCLLAACHFVGDYPFQSEWFVTQKGKSWEVCFYHAATYTAPFVIFAHASWVFAAVLLVSHFVIDPLKARWGVIKTVWQDQLLHAAILAVAVAAGIAQQAKP